MNIKNCIFFFLIFAFSLSFSFYNKIEIEYDYEFNCKNKFKNCEEVHILINNFYKKLSKIWLCLDFFQTVQVSIPQDDINYIEIILDLTGLINFIKNENLSSDKKFFENHAEEKNIIENIIFQLINHPAAENHEILFKFLEILQNEFFLKIQK